MEFRKIEVADLELIKKEFNLELKMLDGYIYLDRGIGFISYDDEVISYLYASSQEIADKLFNLAFIVFDRLLVKQTNLKDLPTQKDYRRVFTSYREVESFMQKQPNRVYSLTNFKRFMKDFGEIQLLLKTIHIGGTNGKGSTTNYLKQVLRENYRVGTFTSPALVSRLDIIRIDDQDIPEEVVVDLANRYLDRWLEYQISLFEIEVFIALVYFFKNRVDYALFEVGLGGELDATNIIRPLVAINTNIGLDHQDYLGVGYQAIAKAKGGIIKPGIDFITGESKPECLAVFAEICQQNKAQLIISKPPTAYVAGHQLKYRYYDLDFVLNTAAPYQIKNSSLAITALMYLRTKGAVNFSDQQLVKGIFAAYWPGRFEPVHNNPLIIIDGAHNPEGIKAFKEAAIKYPGPKKIIFSALKDKDTHQMITELLTITDDVTICEFDHVRAAKAKDLADGFPVAIIPDYHLALKKALNFQGTVFITGSFYFILKIRKILVTDNSLFAYPNIIV